MEHSDGSEQGVNDWVNVQPPAAAHWNDGDDNDVGMVVVPTGPFSEAGSVFPPNNHEGLPVTPSHSHQNQDPPANTVTSSSEEGREGELDVGSGIGGGSIARLGIMSSGIVGIAHGIWRHAVCRAGVLSFTGVVAVVLAAVYGRRWRRKIEFDSKNRLMHLIEQKDEKIKQLLFQIARMNQIISAPRRIPVVRVVVNSSHIVIPRLISP